MGGKTSDFHDAITRAIDDKIYQLDCKAEYAIKTHCSAYYESFDRDALDNVIISLLSGLGFNQTVQRYRKVLEKEKNYGKNN